MSTILLIQVQPEVARQLRSVPGLELRTVASLDAALSSLEGEHVALSALVLGAAVPDPIQAVSRLQLAANEVPVIVLSEPDHEAELAWALRFVPFVSSELRCESVADPARLREALNEVVARAKQSRGLRSTFDALNQRLRSARDTSPRAAEYLGRLLALAPVGICELDRVGRVLSMNPRAATILRTSERAALGRPLSDAFGAPGSDELTCMVKALPTGGPARILERSCEDGSTQYIEVLLASLPAHSGAPGVLVVLQDVTTRVMLELSLRQAERAKDEFLTMLAHELRNPLAPIVSAVQLMRMPNASAAAIERARTVVERQVLHLARLVDDLLDVTRLARSKVELHRESVDVQALTRTVCDDHQPEFTQSGVALEADLGPTPLVVSADPTRLVQVLGNLLGNALKFTGAGGHVTVTLRGEPEAIVFTVRDTGVGIPSDLLPNVFQPFMQADSTLDRSRGGLGLGLAVSRGLVELHGGELSAWSAGPGQGSTFTLRLPRPHMAPSIRPDAPKQHGAPSRRVLVVEDNVDAAETLSELLSLIGHEVRVVSSGSDAVSAALAFRPHVVLCDLGLPDMDGYAVARALRDQHALGGLRLVAVSGYGRPEDRARAREAGFDEHLVKPVDLDAILASLEPPG